MMKMGNFSGEYELKLSRHLTTQGPAAEVDIYGFDPHSSFDVSKIFPLASEDLSASGEPGFDIVLSRWVLHHVRREKRWNEFISCVNRSNKDARIIVVEEGTFTPDTRKSTWILWYEYLLGCADVVVNSILCPSWIFPPAGESRQQFYLEYLTCNDIAVIERAFNAPARRRIQWICAGFFPQILITWTV